ncbi:MAG: DUF4124 domain-containing protein [Zoogloeaceae bacterium]|nr:DUF4124 domain-containing protein [Zoogloeaceae bacterium]
MKRGRKPLFRKYRWILALALSCAAVLPTSVAAETYKCTLDGKSVYQDTPCEGRATGKVVSGGQDYVPPVKTGPDCKTPEECRVQASGREAQRAADAAEGRVQELDRVIERNRAERARQAPTQNDLAEQCVELYKPHMAYRYARITGSSIKRSGFAEISVSVKTFTNSNAPRGVRDPGVLDEHFICQLTDDASAIDVAGSQNRINDHARGVRF